MSELRDQIDAARAKVAHLRIRAERPDARLEDEFALEKARTRLLTLELRHLKQRSTSVSSVTRGESHRQSERRSKLVGTNREQFGRRPSSARERAEAAFSALGQKNGPKKETT